MINKTFLILTSLFLIGCNTTSEPVAAPVSATPPVLERSYDAISGVESVAGTMRSVNPDCTSKGVSTIRILTPPENGKIRIVTVNEFPKSPSEQNNPLQERCGHVKIPGTRLLYTSNKGFEGVDKIVIETITPQGMARPISLTLNVKKK